MAKRRLGTTTIKDTVNVALRLGAGESQDRVDVSAALDTLAAFDLRDREQVWR